MIHKVMTENELKTKKKHYSKSENGEEKERKQNVAKKKIK
jgi:recombinational DNA repair protein RecT